MMPLDWQQLRECFHQATTLPAQERVAYLSSLEKQDPQLAAELNTLLMVDQTEDTIRLSVEQASQDFQNDFDARFLQRQVGPFRLVALIGKGGMGLVYRGQRVTGDFEQEVAVKLMRHQDASILRRIQNERQALSSLSHPHIARIYDAGMLDRGEAYLIMEYVHGDGLNTYLSQHDLSQPQRLELFIKICEAVDYSHRHLIIHRDLKPSNVMVDESGLPKLIDYGIAKNLLDHGLDQQTITLEQAWSPNYASPEQVRGESLTTATDIYALGLILYRLMSGRDAQAVQQLPLDQAITQICEGIPQDLARSGVVSSDLYRVISKAIHKDPLKRYASARELADDVQRYLNGQAVLAVGERLSYHLSKWIGRHRLVTAISSAALLFLAIAVWQVVTQRNAALRSEARALAAEADSRTQLIRANEVSEFLTDIFNAADIRQNAGEDVTARVLLDRAYEDIQTRDGIEPGLKIELLRTIARAYNNTGLEPQALTVLNQAEVLWQEMAEPDPLQRAAILNDTGNAMMRIDRSVEAIPILEEALRIRRDHLTAGDPAIAHTLNNLGSSFLNLEQLEPARDALLQAMDDLKDEGQSTPLTLSAVYHNLARVESLAGQYEQALVYINRSLDIKRQTYGENEVPYADSLIIRAQIARQLKEWALLPADLAQILAIQERKLPKDSWRVIVSLGELSNYYHDIGDYAQAESYYLQELAHPALKARQAEYAITINNLASLYEDTGRYEQALPLYRESRDIRRQEYGIDSYRYSTASYNLGRLLTKMGEYHEASVLLTEAERLRGSQLEASHPGLVAVRLEQLRLRNRSEPCAECLDELNALLTLMEMTQHQNIDNWIRLYEVLGELQIQRGEPEATMAAWDEAYQRTVTAYGEQHPKSLRLASQLAYCESLKTSFYPLCRSIK